MALGQRIERIERMEQDLVDGLGRRKGSEDVIEKLQGVTFKTRLRVEHIMVTLPLCTSSSN